MRFARAMSGRYGELRIAARGSRSKSWARGMALARRGFGIFASARRTREASSPQRHRDTEKVRKLLRREQSADIFDRIRRFSSADEVEAIFTGSRFALTRF